MDVIEREGCEAVVPGLIEFFLFGIAGGIFQQPIGKSKKSALGSKIGLAAIKKLRKPVNDALEKSSRFHPPADIYELADYASEILSLCNSMGEGGCSPLRWWSSFAPAARTWCAPSPSPFAEPRGGQGHH